MWESITNESEGCEMFDCSSSRNRDDIKSDELSLYDVPLPPPCPKSIEDFDQNSQDSGYLSTRRLGCQSTSFGSNSIDDDFFEDFFDIEMNDIENKPQNFDKLISGNVKTNTNTVTPPKDNIIRPLFRRALSLQNENKTTPNSSRVRSCLFRNPDDIDMRKNKFKRPADYQSPPKKARTIKEEDAEEVVKRPRFQRAFSATEESIMCAVQRSSDEPDLIGDFSKTFCLPLIRGRHQDLKSITSDTLAQLLRGIHDDNVASFTVIDCRYPYEYDGGHICGAVNIYTKEQCMEFLMSSKIRKDEDKRNILVFHCEFSSERGPNLYRYLRKEDRQLNQEAYPSLCFPEIYLLEGGYKKFFEEFSELCIPIAYKEMLHPAHEGDLRFFRQKSKTWNVDSRQRPQRANLKRLGL